MQAFRIGSHVYATQFHPELDVAGLCTRIDVYKHAGYFEPEQAGELKAQARNSNVTHPPAILRRFAQRYARSDRPGPVRGGSRPGRSINRPGGPGASGWPGVIRVARRTPPFARPWCVLGARFPASGPRPQVSVPGRLPPVYQAAPDRLFHHRRARPDP